MGWGWNPVKDIKKAAKKVSKVVTKATDHVAKSTGIDRNALQLATLGSGGGLSLANDMLQKPTAEAPPIPGESKAQKDLRTGLTNEAKNYRAGLGDLKRQYHGLLQDDANVAEEKGLGTTRQNYNDRGLLYSGMREKGEQDLRSSVASQLAQSVQQTNEGLEDTAKAKELAAASVGLDSYRDAAQRADQLADLQYESLVSRRQAMQKIGQAAGYGAGYLSSGTAAKPLAYQDQVPDLQLQPSNGLLMGPR